MTQPHPDSVRELRATLLGSWHRFVDVYEPLRPELYRYCRYLTRSPWDAEDLVQDTLARAFVMLGNMHQEIANPRAWLFRVASNLWIDRTRRLREDALAAEPIASSETRVSPEAAGTLIARLSPQERAAVVLKDVFDFTLEETAETLSTTVGAVKAALFRGRGKLGEADTAVTNSPSPAVVSAFCDAFNARDIERMVALLLDTATVDIVGVHTESGVDAARSGSFVGMLYGSRRMSGEDPRGGMDAQHRHGVLSTPARVELRVVRGEALLIHWYAHTGGDAVRAFSRLQTDGEKIVRVRNYFYTPEPIEELCKELGLPCHTNGVRYW
jgi:RNA polymerase sigma-70 factor (ECF subfamily)